MMEIGGEVAQIATPWSSSSFPVPILGGGFPAVVYLSFQFGFIEDSWALVSTAGVPASADAIAVTLPPAPVLGDSLDGGTGAPDRLEFSPVSGAGYYGALLVQEGVQGSSHVILGSQPPLRLPDLSAVGRALATGVPVRWSVFAHLGGPSFAEVTQGARAWGFVREFATSGGGLSPNQTLRESSPGTFWP
jgi:hypothetical protein